MVISSVIYCIKNKKNFKFIIHAKITNPMTLKHICFIKDEL